MTDSQQIRNTTSEEDIRELFSRTAKLSDALSALMDPEWGAKAGILPRTHPLHPDARRSAHREAEVANAAAVLQPSEAAADTAENPTPTPEQRAARNAVYAYIKLLGEEMPTSTVHRNAIIWRGVEAALAGQIPAARDQLAREEENAIRHNRAIARVAELLTQVAGLEQERDGAYRERAHLLAWLAALYTAHAVIVPAVDIEDEEGWHLLFLNIAGRQLSWHIAPRDIALFDRVQRVDVGDHRGQWDGHTTEEKYGRIRGMSRVERLNYVTR